MNSIADIPRLIEDIKSNPDNHRHGDLNGLMNCAMIENALCLQILDAHRGLYGNNGGVPCDVENGPCSCGAWHQKPGK